MNSRKKKLLSLLAAVAITFTIWQPGAAVTVHANSSELDAQTIIQEALLDAAKGTPAAFVKWGTKKLIAAALNTDEESDCDIIMGRLDDVVANQNKDDRHAERDRYQDHEEGSL